ncbi:Diaminobutyrate aminotransferase apoenzyme [Pseudomonas syringae pv. aptata]|uniref:Diaminobutyrate--2-oxoglutarate transaminase n=1 Tax=Pseudomonas syringae pv. aptata TaxID=83167 RepID=A0A0Q0BTA5_PSEAP|nr:MULTISPECIES: diaminobutyrate--2-oxoglutarate transaminase [Pseudomonas]KPY98733.1 Diaminobutyrate aminotransferase apoenzyme [Pseudomonas syringae pv. aptata]NAO51239.1 diaminobutyrate--2-oxoglutarate transaminase [Pseudomonas syringae]MBP1086308.1 diaminobutyrate-2-oxoglutarate transaminase [Pseudomonas sp. PvP007]MBP1192657.1 diaminobutyrate-2-oxoglutarate transaminase [Pseudomonas sp. PvP100]MDP5165287.1 diaminobutyrate--2-oxoglutarate transaminase [Pseudomonas syringae pv. aptata str. 
MNPTMAIYERESNVRSYCRDCDVVFATAQGAVIEDVEGRQFIDFFAGAGSLNYGHNNPRLKKELLDYIQQDGITTTLDFHSAAKSRFIEQFERIILTPRGMNYKLQFTGPTGTNAIEAALKLARKITGRTSIAAFTHAFHGVTLGSLALTANADKRAVSGVELSNVVRLPYDGFLGRDIDSAHIIETMFSSAGAGFEPPAAIILEVVQGEGGLNCARPQWLQRIQRLCQASGALLIIDDIQAGCGRTGTFFSFESADISPDIICLSKSISGYGLPMSLVLIKPEHDQWAPGEHNGTFRGNNTAFVTAAAALSYWQDNAFERSIAQRSAVLRLALEKIIAHSPPEAVRIVGRGLFMGLRFGNSQRASRLSAECLSQGLLVETCGPLNEVLKLMPPLTIDLPVLERGLDILKRAYLSTLHNESSRGIA